MARLLTGQPATARNPLWAPVAISGHIGPAVAAALEQPILLSGFPDSSRSDMWRPVSIGQWAGWAFVHPGVTSEPDTPAASDEFVGWGIPMGIS